MDEKETRQRILDTAARLFGERGKAAVSTAEIAREAGINKAMIFYYFGSKDELYGAALRKWFIELGENLQTSLTGVEPGLSTIEAFVRAHIAHLKAHPELVRLVIRELIASDFNSPEIYRDALKPFQVIRDCLLHSLEIARERGEIRDVDPLHTAVNIISMDVFVFLGKPIVQGINPGIDIDKFVEDRVQNILDLLMNGLRKKPE